MYFNKQNVNHEHSFINDMQCFQYHGYTNWAPGQPNNYHHQQNCAAIDNTGQWNDFECNQRKQFVCSKIGGKMIANMNII